MNKKPSFSREGILWKKNFSIFGIDEVGRGSFAGPLVGAAVSFRKDFRRKWVKDIRDSKQLTHKERVRLSKLITKHCTYFLETIDLETINKIGIGKSNSLLFKKLIKKIKNEFKDSHYLIDGRKSVNKKNVRFIVGGDRSSLSIAAASIVAKVHRDKIMRNLGKTYKGYNFYRNKGYGTKFHRLALRKYGLSDIHRKSFRLERFLV